MSLLECLREKDEHSLTDHALFFVGWTGGVYSHGIVFVAPRNPNRSSLRDADPRAGHVVRVPGHRAHMHDVPWLEAERIDRERRRELHRAPTRSNGAKGTRRELERLPLARAHDVLEARGDE